MTLTMLGSYNAISSSIPLYMFIAAPARTPMKEFATVQPSVPKRGKSLTRPGKGLVTSFLLAKTLPIYHPIPASSFESVSLDIHYTLVVLHTNQPARVSPTGQLP